MKSANKSCTDGPCQCVEQINQQLAPKGARLVTGIQIDFDKGTSRTLGPYLAVERIGKGRKKLPTILCSYCPCCGKALPKK